MYYLIYQITNKLNGKIYIGKHKTEDKNDDYMGSGKYLKASQNLHGIENFEKKILFECASEEEMNEKEAELVNEDFVAREDTYNIAIGGDGGWTYVNRKRDFKNRSESMKKFFNSMTDEEFKKYHDRRSNNNKLYISSLTEEELLRIKEKISKSLKEFYKNKKGTFKNKKHSLSVKKHLSEVMKNKIKNGVMSNPSYGKMWIYNEETGKSLLIDKTDKIPSGFRKGHKDFCSENVRKRINERIRTSTLGKIKIYNINTHEIKLIEPNEKIPYEWKCGSPPLSEETKKLISKKVNEYLSKTKNFDSLKEKYTAMYNDYIKYGFKFVVEKYNYEYSQPNLVGLFKRYVDDYKRYDRFKTKQ